MLKQKNNYNEDEAMEGALFKNSTLSPLIFNIVVKYLTSYMEVQGKQLINSETEKLLTKLFNYFTDINNDPFLRSC